MSAKYEWINSYTWAYIILDEAQAIKNPGTAQTKNIKTLKAHNRIILTGTPIENRLSDLWSLFDFLNPGLLGNRTEFTAFSKRFKNSPAGAVMYAMGQCWICRSGPVKSLPWCRVRLIGSIRWSLK